jgi:hypothetical protein
MLIIISSFTYHAMVQAVSLQFLTAKVRVQPKASLCGICDGKTDSLAGIYLYDCHASFYGRRYIISVTDNVDK